ncbi:hypothetical protein KKH43_00680 [Patescibacteria group bacterium]|nr:hypothetical protein [Patescibacteria group bacterium]
MSKHNLKNAYRFEREGWVYLHIEGEPFERGYQHGYYLSDELTQIYRNLKYLTYIDTGKDWDFFVESARDLFVKHMDDEYIEEMKGIAKGASDHGCSVTWEEILAWNGYDELTQYWWPGERRRMFNTYEHRRKEHCSAFIATKPFTVTGEIIMAHNTWARYETGQFSNLIIDIKPKEGHRIFMQSSPGYIDSFSDYFVTEAGIMGTETTIGDFSMYDADEVPEFHRARKAMQYGESIDDFVKRMLKQNSGGYANSWLLADTNTGEIARFELGLKYYNVERKKDGYFVGYNAAEDPRIRNLECADSGFFNVKRAQGARRVRLTELMEQYKGEIDIEVGKKVLSDHFDPYLQKENPCGRTIEGHHELDDSKYTTYTPFEPKGSVDGKVTSSSLAKELSFDARWGSSSGMEFDANEFLKQHPQWDYLRNYLFDRPTKEWSQFGVGEKK